MTARRENNHYPTSGSASFAAKSDFHEKDNGPAI